MKHVFPLLMVLLAAFISCGDDEEEMSVQPEVSTLQFTYEQGTYAGIDIPYRKAVIAETVGKNPAMVIYLHGGSSRGSDNTAQMSEKGIDSISNYLTTHAIYSVLVVPQCPAGKSWGGAIGRALKAMIDDCVDKNNVDAGRVYIFGGSMGGTGTWELLSAYPELFAAAMPVAGNPSKCEAENVAKTPVYAVMGSDDNLMSVNAVEDFMNQMAIFGAVSRLDIENGWGHETTCIESYTAQRLDWIFSHTR